MKTFQLQLFLTIILAFFGWNTNAQWTPVNNGITNFNTIPLAVSGTDLFAGTYGGGMFFSSDNGANWTAVNTGLTSLDIFSLASDGTNTFAGSFGGGVFRTTNNGASWTAVNNGITNFSIYAMAVNGTNVYAGTLGGGVFLSTDNGASWSAVNTGLSNLNITTLFADGTNLFAGTNGGGAFLSTNNGASWSVVNTGLTNTSVRSFTKSGSTLFTGTGGGGIFSSTDNGTSWTAMNTGLTNQTVWALKAYGSAIFAGTNGGGVFVSTDNGANWTAENAGLSASPDVWSLVVIGTNIFAGINSGGGVNRRPLSELGIVNADFNYTNAVYCANANDPTPTITGLSGGTFSSTSGLSLNGTSGTIDLSASTPGTYTVTYTISGSSSTESVTINAMDDASFSYSAAVYCMNNTDPSPTITGLSGGTFSSTVGLIIDGNSGIIDANTSTAGIYTVTYTTNGNCPNSSNIAIELTQVDNSTVLNGLTITANAAGAAYQWLDCDNGMIIQGETNNSFTATVNGNYAVEITQNGCVDTSACVTIASANLLENDFETNINFYPNPTTGTTFIDLGTKYEEVEVKLSNLLGQQLSRATFKQSAQVEIDIEGVSGFYFVEILTSDNKKATIKVLKK